MVGTSDINVQIVNKSECIYKNTLKNEGHDLNSLISNLKSIQQNVNEVLTKLVQVEQSSTNHQGENLADDDESEEEDESDDEEENSKPKKRKHK